MSGILHRVMTFSRCLIFSGQQFIFLLFTFILLFLVVVFCIVLFSDEYTLDCYCLTFKFLQFDFFLESLYSLYNFIIATLITYAFVSHHGFCLDVIHS